MPTSPAISSVFDLEARAHPHDRDLDDPIPTARIDATATRVDRELVAARRASEGRFENWLPGQDSNLRPSD